MFFNSDVMGHYCYSSNLQNQWNRAFTVHAVLFLMVLDETREKTNPLRKRVYVLYTYEYTFGHVIISYSNFTPNITCSIFILSGGIFIFMWLSMIFILYIDNFYNSANLSNTLLEKKNPHNWYSEFPIAKETHRKLPLKN